MVGKNRLQRIVSAVIYWVIRRIQSVTHEFITGQDYQVCKGFCNYKKAVVTDWKRYDEGQKWRNSICSIFFDIDENSIKCPCCKDMLGTRPKSITLKRICRERQDDR